MYTPVSWLAGWWGKARRAFLISFRKGRVLEKLDRRRGGCHRCGACCKLVFRCPAYDDSGGDPRCLIYNDRPGVCGLFPLDEKDLAERDVVMPDKKCGFFFEDAPATSAEGAGSGPPSRPLRPEAIRWGPPEVPSTESRGLRGTFGLLWSFIVKPKPQEDGPAES
ncbi:MAG TPA: hypothetical protein VEN81_06660 [Planctomycetota bacterium]|nr:hypothetical protein [Planctomycetota bacterium]